VAALARDARLFLYRATQQYREPPAVTPNSLGLMLAFGAVLGAYLVAAQLVSGYLIGRLFGKSTPGEWTGRRFDRVVRVVPGVIAATVAARLLGLELPRTHIAPIDLSPHFISMLMSMIFFMGPSPHSPGDRINDMLLAGVPLLVAILLLPLPGNGFLAFLLAWGGWILAVRALRSRSARFLRDRSPTQQPSRNPPAPA
jgi:hypothetical protein